MNLYNEPNTAGLASEIKAIRETMEAGYDTQQGGTPAVTDHAVLTGLDYKSSGHTGFAGTDDYADVSAMVQHIRDMIVPNAIEIPKGYQEAFLFNYTTLEEERLPVVTSFVFGKDSKGRVYAKDVSRGDMFELAVDLGKEYTEVLVGLPQAYGKYTSYSGQDGSFKEFRTLDWQAQPKLPGFYNVRDIYYDNTEHMNHPVISGAPYIKATQDYTQSERFFNTHIFWEHEMRHGDTYKTVYFSTAEGHPVQQQTLGITDFYMKYADHDCLFGYIQCGNTSYDWNNGNWVPKGTFGTNSGFNGDGALVPGYGLINISLDGTKLKFTFVVIDPYSIWENRPLFGDGSYVIVYGKE